MVLSVIPAVEKKHDPMIVKPITQVAPNTDFLKYIVDGFIS